MTKLRSLLSHSYPGAINKLHGHPRHQGILQMEKSEWEGSQQSLVALFVQTGVEGLANRLERSGSSRWRERAEEGNRG